MKVAVPLRHVAIVMPFFQRESGILARALRSLGAQRLPRPLRVTVLLVDDDSPHRPGAEIQAAALPPHVSVRRLLRANGGPAAARNTALDALPASCDWVAFLDSDDQWDEHHLATALMGLELGHDFYFCDSAMPEETLFDGLAALRDGSGIVAHPARPDLFTFEPGRLGPLMIREYLCQTSTVAVRRRLIDRHRFDPRLRYAGEDWLMWVRLAHDGARTCFSRLAGSLRGEGVNLYRGAHERLSGRNLRRLLSLIRANEQMAQVERVDAASLAFLEFRLKSLRRELAAILLHPGALSGAAEQETRRAIAAIDPGLWRRLPTAWAGILGQRLRRA